MFEYIKDKEITYWNNYYKPKSKRFPNSDFSEFALDKIERMSSLIDIGCGDGRDSYFFSENKIATKGIDLSLEAINQNKKHSNHFLSFECLDLQNINEINEIFDYGYCRFIFHSINESVESTLLDWLSKHISKSIFIETRVFDKENINENTNHYRRFFSESNFIIKIKEHNFKIDYSESSYNFSKYKKIYKVKDLTFDPLILRLIISK